MAHSLTVQNALRTASPALKAKLDQYDALLRDVGPRLAACAEELIKLSGMSDKSAQAFRGEAEATLADLNDNTECRVGMALARAEDEDEAEHDEDEGLYFVGNDPSPRPPNKFLRAAE